MPEPIRQALRWARRWLRWVALGLAVAVLAVFLIAQRQSVSVSYGQSPSAGGGVTEGSAGELSDATVPSADEMTAMVLARPVVRLPGAVAHWDEARVRAAIGDAEIRILVAPPGLDEDERDRIRDVRKATVRVIGTQVTGGFMQATPDTVADWRAQFATGDVTVQLVTLIAAIRKVDTPVVDAVTSWRDPTSAELAPVLADLRRTGRHSAAGATLTEVPKAATTAFPDRPPLVVALPRQPFGEPLPAYGRALEREFPDTPILVMYGDWVEYSGPQAAEFAELAAVTFYAQTGDRLSRFAYPQRNILGAYLNRVTDVRYAGLFERPLPYVPFDPLRVALPALPWLFAACVLAFLLLSVRPAGRPAGRSRPTAGPARLAGLAALAVEQSALTGRAGDPALTRGIAKLTAARSALDEKLPDKHVQQLLDEAEAELDEAGRSLPFPGYRPGEYLRARLQ